MASKTSAKTYTVAAKITSEITIDISASNWDEALEKAQKLKFADFLTTNGEVSYYGSPEIIGIILND